jgi:hypothetical protein
MVGLEVFVIAIMLLESFAPPVFAPAVSYITPLKANDSAFYLLSGNYGFIPSQPVTQMKVLRVSGTNISASFINFFPDGRLSPNGFWIDIFSGQSYNFTSNLFFAISAGLQRDSPIFNNWNNITVAAQQTLTCGGATRAFVGIGFNRYGQSVHAAWDQATGVLCGYTADDSQRGSLSMSMINTTLWGSQTNRGAPDPITLGAEISAILGLPLVAIIMFVYFRKKRAAG